MVCFLKLGGSLITDKAVPQTARPEVIGRLGDEIAAALKARPDLTLILGHGSGSFGHAEARKHGTRQGVSGAGGWRGFAQVSGAAARLNRLVTDSLLGAGVPALSLQPSASAACRDGVLLSLALEPIERALRAGLVPLVYGDVAFDETRGGTIVSTEDLFRHLARHFKPGRVLLAGHEAGVYNDWPAGRTVIPRITAQSASNWSPALQGAGAPDVTGGMAGKVAEMLALSQEVPGLTTVIFSGEPPGSVFTALTEPTFNTGSTIA